VAGLRESFDGLAKHGDWIGSHRSRPGFLIEIEATRCSSRRRNERQGRGSANALHVGSDAACIAYHDLEWGVPVHDDNVLFEFLTLEGAQRTSWETILKKREPIVRHSPLRPDAVATFKSAQVAVCSEIRIVRNRLKIGSTVATPSLPCVQREFGSFDA